MRVLGIDPGLRNTGFGVIEVVNKSYQYISSGTIVTDSKLDLGTRLKTIATGISEIIDTFNPKVMSIEQVFVNVNPKSTLLLGQARGAAITAGVLKNLEVFEYTALRVKQSVVGYGHADKDQVIKMIKLLLKVDGNIQKDASDALAIAITHVHYSSGSR